MEEIKPIKRSKELAPLSREHHDGLLFVWKLRQGLANNTPVETLRDYIRWFWTNHLMPHFMDEEKVLLKFLPADNTYIQQMVREHEYIRDLIITLDKETKKTTIELLADSMNNHIRFEERQLFGYAEQALSPEQLNLISLELANESSCNTDPTAIGWKNEFWVKK